MSVWSDIAPLFTKKEAWGDPLKMEPEFLLELHAARKFINEPFYILQGTQGKHASKSQHYLGLACDFIIDAPRKHPLDILIALERFDFTGIGYYPHWKYDGRVTGGWHLDKRKIEPYGFGARWMGILLEDGNQTYVDLSYKNLVKFGVI